MKNLFFRAMCWIDDKINHPLLDEATNEKVSNASYRFCNYAWTNRTDLKGHEDVKDKQDKLDQ